MLSVSLVCLVLTFLFLGIATFFQVRNIKNLEFDSKSIYAVFAFGLFGVLSGIVSLGAFLIYLFKG